MKLQIRIQIIKKYTLLFIRNDKMTTLEDKNRKTTKIKTYN